MLDDAASLARALQGAHGAYFVTFFWAHFSPEKELARRFLAFMMSPGFQDQIPTNNWMFPAGTTSAPLPPAFDQLVKPSKTLLYSPEDVDQNRRAWIDEWLNATAK